MDKRLGFGIAAVFLVAVIATGALAFMGGWRNPAVASAIQAGDYNAYINAVNDVNITKPTPLSQDQFNVVVQRQKDMTAINTARQQAAQAITNNDYSAWQTAMTSMIDAQKTALDDQKAQLTQDNFNMIVQRSQMGRGMMRGRMFR